MPSIGCVHLITSATVSNRRQQLPFCWFWHGQVVRWLQACSRVLLGYGTRALALESQDVNTLTAKTSLGIGATTSICMCCGSTHLQAYAVKWCDGVLNMRHHFDLRVCESTDALRKGLFMVESERAGEAAAVTWPLMEARAASRRILSASRPCILQSLACTTLRISAWRAALSRTACFCSYSKQQADDVQQAVDMSAKQC